MFKKILILPLLLLVQFSWSQITIIGHTEMNTYPLNNVKVIVKENNAIIQTLNTGKKSSFNLALAFDKKYSVYLQHQDCPVMFFEVDSKNIPADKQSIKMIHELDIPFYHVLDEDIDTTRFAQPCQKIYFDGKSKMVSDTGYINSFY